MHLADLLQHSGLTPPDPSNPHAPVQGITEDSRLVKPGWVFIARPGLHADGRRFIPDAINAGALLIITDKAPAPAPNAEHPTTSPPILTTPHPAKTGAILAETLAGNPSAHLKLVGVTGTNGKSTVTALISQIATHADTPCGLIGTVNIDDGFHKIPSDFTTPPAERLSPMLARMVQNRRTAAAIEVSSHALCQHRVAGLRFAAAVFTNLTGDHLDYHKDMHAYAAAKASLFAMLSPDALAVVNANDPATDTMLEHCPARVLACTISNTPPRTTRHRPGISPTVEILSTRPTGMNLRITGLGQTTSRQPHTIETTTTLFGNHNAMNLLQAAVVCIEALGIHPDDVAAAIPALHTPTGRLERVSTDADPITVFVDFAHTDDALASALRAARRVTPKDARLWVVFGCGGNKDRAKRPRMGHAAATLADLVVATSDNPRTEDPEAILDEIVTGIPTDRRPTLHRDPDRRAAINTAIAQAQPGDVVVIAGKGHEREQVLADSSGATRTIPFDDHEIARQALHARSTTTPNPNRRPLNPAVSSERSAGSAGSAGSGGSGGADTSVGGLP